MSYYERWFEVISANLLRAGLVSERELETGYRDPDQPLPTQLPDPTETAPSGTSEAPTFGINDTVLVRNLHPRGHTRVPRYVRGKRGVVVTDNGVWTLQDTDERGQRLGNFPQHVYTVRFESQELWGNRGAVNDAIYVDLWEEYLEPV
jgi:nitrile hydratase